MFNRCADEMTDKVIMFNFVTGRVVQCCSRKEGISDIRLFIDFAVSVKQIETLNVFITVLSFETDFEFTKVGLPVDRRDFKNVYTLRKYLKSTV